MTPRPRKSPNKNLPEHLYYDKNRKRYRFTLKNGIRKVLGTDKNKAIAIEYNNLVRYKDGISVGSLIVETNKEAKEFMTFSSHIDYLVNRIIKEERLSKNTIETHLNDAERVKEFFSDVMACDIDLSHVNEYLNKFHANSSANVQNRKISFLKKLFAYAMDESIMLDNPASRKKMKKKEEKKRHRLKFEWFMAIRNFAISSPEYLYLKTAMDLAMQSTQAVLEISRIQYKIDRPSDGVCGFVWFDEPKDGIYGTLYIHRQKVSAKEASHIAVPVGEELRKIVIESRDNILSPYVVHRLPDRSIKPSKEVTHFTQLTSNYLSRAFSKIRDQIGICDHLKEDERPTFHEIRALAAHLFDQQGISPQARMAHSDEKSTKIYTANHHEWVMVPHAEIKYKVG